SLVEVDAVVPAGDAGEVLDVGGSPEELHVVVLVLVDVDVVDVGGAADGAQGQAVDLVVGGEVEAAIADGDVAQGAAVVVVADGDGRRRVPVGGGAVAVEAQAARGHQALDLELARGIGGGQRVVGHVGTAEQDHAAPLP